MTGERFATIVADPPWAYPEGHITAEATGVSQNRTRDAHARVGAAVRRRLPYESMSVEQIAALPVDRLADTSARLFCWVTNRYLPDAFAIIDGWGFRYRQTLVWHKTGVSPFPLSVAPGNAEFLLVAQRGTPGRGTCWPSSVVTHGAPKEHSRKPETFLDLIEQVSPGPYLELFARRQRLGWSTWGDQALEHVTLSGCGGGGA